MVLILPEYLTALISQCQNNKVKKSSIRKVDRLKIYDNKNDKFEYLPLTDAHIDFIITKTDWHQKAKILIEQSCCCELCLLFPLRQMRTDSNI